MHKKYIFLGTYVVEDIDFSFHDYFSYILNINMVDSTIILHNCAHTEAHADTHNRHTHTQRDLSYCTSRLFGTVWGM